MTTTGILLGQAWRRLFRTPTARIAVPMFAGLCALYTFTVSPFFMTGTATLRPFFEFVPFLLTFFAPALTMRTLAESRRSGTLDVVQTWPVAESQIVVAEFAAAFALLLVALGLTACLPAAVVWAGPLDLGAVLAGYVGIGLLGGACLAIGLAASALAESQLVAYLSAFLVCFLLHIIGNAAPVLPPQAAAICEWISFDIRAAGFARGIIDLRDVVFFLSVITVGLAVSVEGLKARRW